MDILDKDKIRFLQIQLNLRFVSGLTPDGISGKKTLAAIRTARMVNVSWPDKRALVGAIQRLTVALGFDVGIVDGFWGPATDAAFLAANDLQTNKPIWVRPDSVSPVQPVLWPRYDTDSLTDFYGPPRTGHGKVNTPYPLKLAWNLDVTINRFTAHSKIVQPVEEVLKNVLDHYGIDEIKRLKLDLWGGCFNNRKIRGGSRLSTHAFACSIDWNPTENRLRQNASTASFARSEYDAWWEMWEAVGAVSLGRAKNFDWMHVQFATV